MASGQDSSSTTLMDLITSDPSAVPAGGASSHQQSSSSAAAAAAGGALGRPAPAPADRKSKRGTLSQIQNETISAAKALNKALPQRNRKKKASLPLPQPPAAAISAPRFQF
ncbi:Os03g0265666 [Oryza sativa Japonica Group]|uniref:Os03g0265666 protein n=1 Tax=Oryza sativa subsp. japonica TaxID=39947 RepID=A0A0P0VVU9_ORYSJ|nr:hypothetical protein EE612_016666 [Oryza sativa]BAS83406.1 Os03g0265666 [Oryza sativa Japonica Group]